MHKTIACPSCGGQQEVHNPGITLVVCEYCSSSIYWDEEAVLNAGKKSILAHGDTRLYDGATGTLKGRRFKVIGHVRYDYGAGTWDEFYLELEGGDTVWLSEDERELSLEKPLEVEPGDVPSGQTLSTGQTLSVNFQTFTVREVGQARCVGTWGQLPFQALPDDTYPYADIADASGGRFGTLEYDRGGVPRVFLGEPLAHDDLVVEGTPPSPVETGAAEPESGASITCPGCAAPLEKPTGREVETLVCEYCGTQNDLTGAEARAMGKNPEGFDPKLEFEIAQRGTFDGAEYEVIGRFLMVDDEGYEARQYLLWNPDRDYLYLEEESGEFVLNQVTTQAPSEDPFDLDEGDRVTVGGEGFRFEEDGTSTLRYVDGALPWIASVGDQSDYADFSGARDRVFGVERTEREIEYFFGTTMSRNQVRAAFGMGAAPGGGPAAGAGAPRVAARPVKKSGCLRSCLFLGVGSIILIVILGALGTAGVSWAVREEGKKMLETYRASSQELDQLAARVEEAKRSEPWLAACEPASTGWPSTIETARAGLAEIEGTTVAELDKELAEDSFFGFPKVGELTTQVRDHRKRAMAPVEAIQADLDRWLSFKRELPDRVAQYETGYERVGAAKLAPLARTIQRAKKDWPDNDHARLTKLFDAAAAAQKEARDIWKENAAAHQAAKRGELNPAVCQSLPAGWDAMASLGESVQQAQAQIPALARQLYSAWEKELVDMEIKEGLDVTFSHKYRVVRVTMEPGAKPSEPKVEESWETVTKSVYDASEPYMGMAVAHKAAGKYDDQAVSEVTPMGYSMLAAPDQEKNRFGRWQPGGGDQSKWMWAPAFVGLGAVLWGTHHVPTRGLYRGYHDSHAKRQIFYGGVFGNQGSFTRARFGDARYYRNNMYKSTRYISSGRTFRGTRYTSSYRSGSSSGSRFGGGK